ncbi:hypothetical protein [Staphylococcus aureus]|uniref:hypothetical protein n=1 Tax=Staphylococcus TaxID=1279 RepID=UPI0005E27981|nr:hypothetical protein [Staphylococcus aureus]MBG3486506.1 hypothetical protein [Staphylococcus aureus]CFH41727.1 Uncharacterised protein [Staphylococcus aureus]
MKGNALVYICYGLLGAMFILIIIWFWINMLEHLNNDFNKTYSSFEKDTKVIKGEVVEAQKEDSIIGGTKYQLIVKTSPDHSQLIDVDEKQYRDYQKGSKVHFRIDKSDDNSVLLDLKKERDFHSKKDYEKYIKTNKKGIFSFSYIMMY